MGLDRGCQTVGPEWFGVQFLQMYSQGDVLRTNDVFTSSSGHKLVCKYWTSENSNQEPKCLVFISHGVAEHCMWYNDLANKLVREGCKVFAHDHAGHGESEGERVHIEDFSVYCNDVVSHVNKLRGTHTNLPCFVIGHSMGGAIAIMSALKNPDLFSGVILISPAVMVDTKTVGPFKIIMSRIASMFVPQSQVGCVSPDWLSSDAEICKRYKDDPLVWHGGLKARWACCMLDAMNHIQNNLEKITFPFFLLHGSEDKICALNGSTVMHEKSRSIDKTLKVYQGAYHQVHNECEGIRDEAIEDIIQWIHARLSEEEDQYQN